MQRLYENHKVLTYPRTDSRYIGKDVVPTIKERIEGLRRGSLQEAGGHPSYQTNPDKRKFRRMIKKSAIITRSSLRSSLCSWII